MLFFDRIKVGFLLCLWKMFLYLKVVINLQGDVIFNRGHRLNINIVKIRLTLPSSGVKPELHLLLYSQKTYLLRYFMNKSLTIFSKHKQRPLLVLHQPGHQLHSQPDDQHPQCGVQQEVHQVPVVKRGFKNR